MLAKMPMTVIFDQDLAEVWQTLWKFKQISFEEFLKEMLLKETLKYSTVKTSDELQSLIGTLPTTLDYKQLREQMIAERLQDYEHLH